MQALSEHFPAVTGMTVILAAAALILAGVSLIGVEVRRRGESLLRRIQLVQASSGISIADGRKSIVDANASFIRVRAGVLPVRQQKNIARQLRMLGVPENYSNRAFAGGRAFLVLGLGSLSFLLMQYFSIFAGSSLMMVLVATGLGIAGWFLPMMIVHVLGKGHKTAVVMGLPDALELLVICVDAGLSLEDSLARISGELKRSYPALAEELALTLADIKILPSRDEAFANLATRVDAPPVRSIVATLIQTMRYGTPLAQALRTAATELRNDSLTAMEGRANKLPALLTVPMMLFIMPTIFLIVGGPAALRVMDTFFL